MKEKGKGQKTKLLPFQSKTNTKVKGNKDNIKSKEVLKKKSSPLQLQTYKKMNTIQSTIRLSKRKSTIKIKSQEEQSKSKAKASKSMKKQNEDGYIRSAYSVQLRRNRFNNDQQNNRGGSLSIDNKQKQLSENIQQIVRKIHRTTQVTPSNVVNKFITFQKRRLTMPIEIFNSVNRSKKIKQKLRKNCHTKPQSSMKQDIKLKKTIKRKKAGIDFTWSRGVLEDKVSDIVRLSTNQQNDSFIQSIQVQHAILTEDSDIDLWQLRQLQFQIKKHIKKKQRISYNISSSDSYFNKMATKIQLFWRQYKTKKIIYKHTQYNNNINTSLYPSNLTSKEYHQPLIPLNHNSVSILQNNSPTTEDLQLTIKTIKSKQMQKWNDVIKMVEQAMKTNKNPNDLLKNLLCQSQINKLSLQQQSNELLYVNNKQHSQSSNIKQQFTSLQKPLLSQNKQKSQAKSNNNNKHYLIARPHTPNLFNKKTLQKIEINIRNQTQSQNTCLKRDRCTLSQQHYISQDSSSQQSQIVCQDQEFDNVTQLLIKILDNIDKEEMIKQLVENVITNEVIYLWKELKQNKIYQKHKKNLARGDSNVIEVKNIPKKTRKIRGIRSNLVFLKQYLKSLGEFILNLEGEPLKRLENASGPTTLEMLKYMRCYQDDQEDDEKDDEIILSTEIYEYHWNQFCLKLNYPKYYYSDEQLQSNHQDFLRRLTNIHCRSIFDTLNQSLEQMRNYGQFGVPFPWKRTPSFFHYYSLNNQSQTLQLAIKNTIKIASNYCGIIFDKQQYEGAPIPSPEYVEQIQQQRLSKSLAQQLIQNQQKWLFYDDQQTQTLIQISYKINQYLVSQVAIFLYKHYI